MRYVVRNGQLEPKRWSPSPARSALPCPAIRSDGMDAIQSMADGQRYDSKSAYYASLKAKGCEIVGDDRSGFGKPADYDAGEVSGDIADAVEQLRAQ